jgi:carbonic anhydrase
LDRLNEPITGEIPFGELMATLDTNNRWVYRGSLTTPPCSKTIYFNILYKVYPIKKYHVDLFKNQLARVPGLKEKGNFRIVMPIDT